MFECGSLKPHLTPFSQGSKGIKFLHTWISAGLWLRILPLDAINSRQAHKSAKDVDIGWLWVLWSLLHRHTPQHTKKTSLFKQSAPSKQNITSLRSAAVGSAHISAQATGGQCRPDDLWLIGVKAKVLTTTCISKQHQSSHSHRQTLNRMVRVRHGTKECHNTTNTRNVFLIYRSCERQQYSNTNAVNSFQMGQIWIRSCSRQSRCDPSEMS